MNKYLCILLLLMISAASIFCINQMNIIQTMTGEFNGSEYGNNMASIDFNADGYDDLVVSASAWNPNGVYNEQQRFGKLYFYWGGPSFDNIPDMVLPGTHYLHYYGQSLFNAGDINGDGLDDLVISNRDSTDTATTEIFYSRIYPHTTPDAVIIHPLNITHNVYTFPLGDINGDNHADLGFFYSEESQRYGRRLMILTDITAQPVLFRGNTSASFFSTLSGVGDINHDGKDDFYMRYSSNEPEHNRLVLYYGNSTFPLIDSLVISNNTQSITSWWGNPAGDVNGDGFADFIAYGNHLWLGSNNLTPSWDVFLNSVYGSSENYNQYPFQHGDLNNDGFDDIISSNYYYGSYHGAVNIWLGCSNMNGTVDLNLWNPSSTEHCNFGYAKAIGDFNADGCDDIAVSAPWWMNHDGYLLPGKVFIYAGNAQLEDTTVANEDDIMPNPDALKWDINIYPNPVHDKLATIMIEFIGTEYIKSGKLQLDIFNIKGQKLMSKSITRNAIKSGCLNLNLKNLSSGNYLVSIRDNRQIRTTKKFNITTK